MPDDPIKGAAEAAVMFHEMYVNFTRAGFTENQALYLVGKFAEGLAGRSA
jgi:hypothetical protein